MVLKSKNNKWQVDKIRRKDNRLEIALANK